MKLLLNSTKTLLFELIFLMQSIMQNFLRQRLMIMSTKFVAKNSLMLLFIAYWAIHYTNLSENDQLIQLLNNSMIVSFSKSIRNSMNRNVDDTIYFDRLFVNFIEREFFIVVWFWMILYSCNFVIACFC